MNLPHIPDYPEVSEVDAAIEAAGFVLPANLDAGRTNPVYTAQDFASMHPAELAQELSIWTQRTNWANSVLADARVRLDLATDEIKARRAELLGEVSETEEVSPKITLQKAAVERHQDITGLRRRLAVVQAFHRKVEALAAGYELKFKAVSRVVALLTGEVERETRVDNAAGAVAGLNQSVWGKPPAQPEKPQRTF